MEKRGFGFYELKACMISKSISVVILKYPGVMVLVSGSYDARRYKNS